MVTNLPRPQCIDKPVWSGMSVPGMSDCMHFEAKIMNMFIAWNIFKNFPAAFYSSR